MKTYLACLPCIMNLMESTLDKTEVDETSRQVLLNRFTADLSKSDLVVPPARISGEMYLQVLQETDQEDLFRSYKHTSIQEALKLYPRLKELVRVAGDPLNTAIRISALGNILDVANPEGYDLDEEIGRLMDNEIQGDSYDGFRTRLNEADSLLILADNAGETVFDRVLIETLGIPVIYAVKSGPAFDDALIEDARLAGIDRVAQLIETGTPYPGTYLPSCTDDFQELFHNAPLILAKGQANFETLNDTSRDIFFLLRVKCEVVSQEIGHPLGSLTLKYYPQKS